MEGIIHSRLLSHLIENSLISEKQGAYMKGDSTTNQLLYIVHQIRSAWQKGDICQAAFADVEGAFEKVNAKTSLARRLLSGRPAIFREI